MGIVKSLKESALITNGPGETTENKANKQKGEFLLYY